MMWITSRAMGFIARSIWDESSVYRISFSWNGIKTSFLSILIGVFWSVPFINFRVRVSGMIRGSRGLQLCFCQLLTGLDSMMDNRSLGVPYSHQSSFSLFPLKVQEHMRLSWHHNMDSEFCGLCCLWVVCEWSLLVGSGDPDNVWLKSGLVVVSLAQ